MMMSCDWHKVVNKSGADLWQLGRPSSYPAVAARRAAKLQSHGKVEQLPEISQSQSQWRGALGASCLTGFSTRETWHGSHTKPHWTGLKRAQRSRWISSRITIILEYNSTKQSILKHAGTVADRKIPYGSLQTHWNPHVKVKIPVISKCIYIIWHLSHLLLALTLVCTQLICQFGRVKSFRRDFAYKNVNPITRTLNIIKTHIT